MKKHPATSSGSLANAKPRFGAFARFTVAAFAAFAAASAHAAQIWHVAAATGSDSNDGLTAETAFASIQKAIDSAAWGDRVLVGDGIYAPISATNQLLTIESVNGPDNTVIDGGYPEREERCATLTDDWYYDDQTNVVVRGFTLRNGHVSYWGGGCLGGTLEHCVVSNNVASSWNGGGAYKGHWVDCLFVGNSAGDEGGGVSDGVLDRCVLSNNCVTAISGKGGASYATTARNCLFVNNSAPQSGGAAYSGNLINCTLFSNFAPSGSGMIYGKAVNCIFYNPLPEGNLTNAIWTIATYCCLQTTNGVSGTGTGNIVANPLFENAEEGDFRIQTDSPCLDAGTLDAEVGDLDLLANPRIRGDTIDMGAIEIRLPGTMSISVELPDGGAIAPGSMTLKTGELQTFRAWGPRPFLGFYTNGVLATTSPQVMIDAGEDDITLVARFDSTAGAINVYVDQTATSPLPDGHSPEAAFPDIQSAIDAALPGDTVVVYPGVYTPISTVKAVTVSSVSGSEETVIDGGGTNRCATLRNSPMSSLVNTATLMGFTLRNGAADVGGGSWGGILWGCVVTGNAADDSGGGIASSEAHRCIIRENRAGYGGGASSSELYDCIVELNFAQAGGGVEDCTAVRCVLRNNTADGDGGGGLGGNFLSSLLVGNVAGSKGGAIFGSYDYFGQVCMVNCTVVGNSADTAGGGVYAEMTEYASNDEWCSYPDTPTPSPCQIVAMSNCILWDNHLMSGNLDNWDCADEYGNRQVCGEYGFASRYTCTTPCLDGVGDIDEDPRFVGNGDYHLCESSPCLDVVPGGRYLNISPSIWTYEVPYTHHDPHSHSWEEPQTPGLYTYYSFLTGLSSWKYNPFCIWFTYEAIEGLGLDDVGDALDLDGFPRWQSAGIDMGAYERRPASLDEISFGEIWGGWSQETAESPAMPDSAVSWNSLAQALWRVRDAFVRSGAAMEIPPSTNRVVLSVGALAVPGSLLDELEGSVPPRMENGIPAYHVHLREDRDSGDLVLADADGAEALSPLPTYLAEEWTRSVYGEPPEWLSATGRAEWFSARARSRIEWLVTLVPETSWTAYCEARSAVIADAEDAAEGEAVFAMDGIVPSAQSGGAHHVSVLSSYPGTVRLFGTHDLSAAGWEYRGLALQPRGSATAGALADDDAQFFFAVRENADTDGDGIPDSVETYVLGTNPRKTDTSGDGLSDREKAYRLGLDPSVRDTAGDGVSDVEKIELGVDPRVPVPEQQRSAASQSIRYHYDDDGRLIRTWSGLGGGTSKTDLSPAGNPETTDLRVPVR